MMTSAAAARRFLAIRNDGKAIEDRVVALTTFLREGGDTSVPADVMLEVGHQSSRASILGHIQQLYDACSAVDINVDVDIVPVMQLGTTGDDDDPRIGHQRLSQQHILENPQFQPNYGYVAMGGTFDRLHSGHKMLLTSSALHAVKKLRIGITGPELLKNKKFAEFLQPYEVRERRATEFVSKLREDLELEPALLFEASGGTDSIPEVEALVVSPETKGAVDAINAKRKEKGLLPMKGVSIEYIGGDESSRVSSTKLREHAKLREE